MKRLILVSAITLLLVLFFSGCTDPDTPVIFEDQNLETCIRNYIFKPQNEPLTIFDVEDITNLNCSNMNIAGLGGIENLSMLFLLEIEDNQITDLSALSNLSDLDTLKLRNNFVNSVKPLLSISSLGHVDITGNCIFDQTNIEKLEDQGCTVEGFLQQKPENECSSF